ncbi:helix-turn-helix transcriptional regulator [Alicyclobacillus cycloheptanicus]|uniref:DNA-binding NarL/FixJ family response regulator n=1 Tax=Alicyclobacillus cycloheptanicus TaxID=1457 RepID=A0ABT9XJL1_9BACL|nr:helix-turn-helix transcriptional regulator [Alicyclobacillus cycloheptanicus]MDQ0189901.1 DNA-binding NarL/FixJ family response regulator [Alicyclobacillus cycloheptanicus]WDM02195.1 helix-turn-helix transcriptional regulator [Alicyclobacillus cycloheptanicus]
MGTEEHTNVNAPIRLILQFEVDGNGTTLHKEVIVDLEPDASPSSANPIHVINRMTAAILQLLGQSTQRKESVQKEPTAEDIPFKGFTAREMDVLSHVMTGATNAEIAKSLGISPNTVKYHVKNILQKLHVKNRVELAIQFHQRSSSESRT